MEGEHIIFHGGVSTEMKPGFDVTLLAQKTGVINRGSFFFLFVRHLHKSMQASTHFPPDTLTQCSQVTMVSSRSCREVQFTVTPRSKRTLNQ